MDVSGLWLQSCAARAVLVCLTSALALGCARQPEPAAGEARPEQTVALGQSFQLARGKAVAVRDGELRIGFEGVAEDSRCPTDVQCVWAGDARVVLRLTQAGRATAVDTLRLTLEPHAVTYDGYVIRLEGLQPAPRQKAPPKPDDYVATLVVTIAGGSR